MRPELDLNHIYKFVKNLGSGGTNRWVCCSARMRKIKSPRHSSTSRFDECQEAIESQLQDLIADATAAGWSKAETLVAIIEVSENLAIGVGEEEEFAAILAAVKQMR